MNKVSIMTAAALESMLRCVNSFRAFWVRVAKRVSVPGDYIVGIKIKWVSASLSKDWNRGRR